MTRLNGQDRDLTAHVRDQERLCPLPCLPILPHLLYHARTFYFLGIQPIDSHQRQVFHVLFLAASSGFQYLFVTVDVALVLFFGYNAYIRADQLERFEAPIVGPIALLWSEQDAL